MCSRVTESYLYLNDWLCQAALLPPDCGSVQGLAVPAGGQGRGLGLGRASRVWRGRRGQNCPSLWPEQRPIRGQYPRSDQSEGLITSSDNLDLIDTQWKWKNNFKCTILRQYLRHLSLKQSSFWNLQAMITCDVDAASSTLRASSTVERSS